MKKTVILAFVLVITGLVGYELYERWLWQPRQEMVDGVIYQTQGPNPAESQVAGCDPEAETLTIQEKYKGLPVTMILPGAFLNSKVRSITIPSNIRPFSSLASETLEEIVFQGNLEYSAPAFDSFPPVKRVVFTEFGDFNFDVFDACETLEEIHLPRGWDLGRSHPNPKKYTWFLSGTKAIQTAVESGLTWSVEKGSNVKSLSLSEAMEDQDVSLQMEEDVLTFKNNTDFELVLSYPSGMTVGSIAENGKIFLLDGYSNGLSLAALEDQDREVSYLFLGLREEKSFNANWFADYGPGQTNIDFVAEDDYCRYEIVGGPHEVRQIVELQPYERQRISLPEGRYGIRYGHGLSAEQARENVSESYNASRYAEYPADQYGEYSQGLVYERMQEYGPGSSTLYLKQSDSQDTCYRLYRVCGELEQEIKLFGSIKSANITVPSGRYMLRIASGSEWRSEEEAFGSDGSYRVIHYQTLEPGEAYEIRTTIGAGNVYSDSAGGFNGH